MVYGFKGLVADFLPTHPGHHICPKRVNGSGVETLFSQLKHTTSGNLTGHNYETAKATLLTKRMIHGSKTKDDYRSTPLNIRQSELKRKKRAVVENQPTHWWLLQVHKWAGSVSPCLYLKFLDSAHHTHNPSGHAPLVRFSRLAIMYMTTSWGLNRFKVWLFFHCKRFQFISQSNICVHSLHIFQAV